MPQSRTVQDVFDRASILLGGKKFVLKEGSGAFTQAQGYQLIKDAYDTLTDALHSPRGSQTVQPVAGMRKYPIPDDCYDNFNGILTITFAGVPLVKIPSIQDVQDRFGHLIDYTNPTETDQTWYNPTSVVGIVYYFCEDDEKFFSVINTPAAGDLTNNNAFEVKYVVETIEPAATTDVVPEAFSASIKDIGTYVAGRCLEAEKSGRGAALLEEFEARILKRKARYNRKGRRTTPEGYTLDMQAYRINYKGRLGGYWR